MLCHSGHCPVLCGSVGEVNIGKRSEQCPPHSSALDAVSKAYRVTKLAHLSSLGLFTARCADVNWPRSSPARNCCTKSVLSPCRVGPLWKLLNPKDRGEIFGQMMRLLFVHDLSWITRNVTSQAGRLQQYILQCSVLDSVHSLIALLNVAHCVTHSGPVVVLLFAACLWRTHEIEDAPDPTHSQSASKWHRPPLCQVFICLAASDESSHHCLLARTLNRRRPIN